MKSKGIILLVAFLLPASPALPADNRRPGNTVIAESEFRMGPAGGNFAKWKDTQAKLPLVKAMGANTLFLWAPYQASKERGKYLMPAWTSRDGNATEIELDMRNNGWCVPNLYATDFLKPDPRRGSEQEFLELIQEAHRLGLKVIGQVVVTGSYPGDFIHDKHPDWLLQTRIGDKEYPAVFWPWGPYSWGYVVNKAHPGLIDYLTQTVLPHWLKQWKLDGIFFDSPGMLYCPSRVKTVCQAPAKGAEYLTPVDEDPTPDALTAALKAKIAALAKESGRELSLSGEMTPRGIKDFSDELLRKVCSEKTFGPAWALPVDRSLGTYFDFVWDYQQAAVLRSIVAGTASAYSTSKGYTALFLEQRQGEGRFTKLARFVNMVNTLHQPENWAALRPRWAGPLVALSVTSPGNVIWIGHWLWDVEYAKPWCEYFLNRYGVAHNDADVFEKCRAEVTDPDITRGWYERTIRIKQAHAALEGDNIENALISPQDNGVIAYNRWSDRPKDSVTVVVNLTAREAACQLKTRFAKNKPIRDLLSRTSAKGQPDNLAIVMPAYSAAILATEK